MLIGADPDKDKKREEALFNVAYKKKKTALAHELSILRQLGV